MISDKPLSRQKTTKKSKKKKSSMASIMGDSLKKQA
jgi:hypothetical protein